MLSDQDLKRSSRSLLDQLTEDELRKKRGVKMTLEELYLSDKVIGGSGFICSANEGDCINRHDAYLLCKQLLTAIQIGRFVKLDFEDMEWAMALVEMRLGGGAKHLSVAAGR